MSNKNNPFVDEGVDQHQQFGANPSVECDIFDLQSENEMLREQVKDLSYTIANQQHLEQDKIDTDTLLNSLFFSREHTGEVCHASLKNLDPSISLETSQGSTTHLNEFTSRDTEASAFNRWKEMFINAE